MTVPADETMSSMANHPTGSSTAAPTNGRDLGGLATEAGHRFRPGLVYRSDDTGWGAGAHAAGLPEQAATAFDLRRPEEVAERGLPWFVGGRTNRISRNLAPAGTVATTITDDVSLADFYLRLFEAQTLNLGDIARLLATEVELPAVVYCVAGKDRTGVVVATLGMLLEIRREDLVRDYARSRTFMDGVVATGRLGDVQDVVALPLFWAPPRAMELLLDRLSARFPTPEDLAEELHVSHPDLHRLRERLLS